MDRGEPRMTYALAGYAAFVLLAALWMKAANRDA